MCLQPLVDVSTTIFVRVYNPPVDVSTTVFGSVNSYLWLYQELPVDASTATCGCVYNLPWMVLQMSDYVSITS